MIKKAFLKIISLLIIVGMNWSAISLIGGTDAHFYDIEESPNNLFSATKLDFSLDFLMSDGFRTQTQGGWGAKPKGNNPGFYRDENFGSTFPFPEGLTIGNIDYYDALCMSTVGEMGDYYANFSSSEVIEDFLPAKGTPAVFLRSYNDPLDTEAGILAGQVVALTLNIGFDNDDPDFSVNEGKLADFYANEAGSLCEEMTTGEVLAEANLILSGGSSEFSPSGINECVTEINEKFVDGERTKITTSESVWRTIAIEKHDGLNFKYTIKIEQISEDSDLCDELKVGAYLNGELVYSGNLLDIFNEEPEEPIVFSESTNSWKLYISLGEDTPSIFSNKSCEFKYIILGWQEDIEEGGFSDVEEIFDSVESGEWDSAGGESLGVSDGPVLLNSDSDASDDDTDAKDEDDADADAEDGTSDEDDDAGTDEDVDDMKEEDSDDAEDEASDEDDSDDDTEDDVDADGSTALQDNGASEDDGEASDGDEDDVDEGDEVEDNDDTDAKDEENNDFSEEDDDADADDMKEEDNDDTDADDIKEEDGGDVEDEGDTEKDDDVDANGSTALQDNGASEDDADDDTDADDMKEEDGDDAEDGSSDEDDSGDNTEGSAQDDGADDGLNKNMVDSVQVSV